MSDGHVYLEHSYSWHQRGLHGFTPEAEITGLEHALRTIPIPKARILWSLLLKHSHLIQGMVETSTNQSFNKIYKTETMVSHMGRLCLETAWLPNRRGVFHRPCDLSLSDLPAAFETQSHEAKKLAAQLEMRHIEIQEVADKLSLPSHVLAGVMAVHSRDPKAIEQFLATYRKPVFPQHESPNPARRMAKL